MEEIVQPLVNWYKKNARDLPWRRDVTPYRVWISEIMLQQTRIEAARGYYDRFMSAFPDVQTLAEAEEDSVLKCWEGLGYYSRARNLHAAAKVIVSQYGGELPRTAEELRKLPGIGEYTAGAVASLAWGEPEPAVDGNVLRVLSRVTRSAGCVGDDRVRKHFREELRAVYPKEDCGSFTAALMELGETVCVPGTPECGACPLAGLCEAHRCGEETRYPVMPQKKPRRIENRRVMIMLCGDRCALRKRPGHGLLAGLWELPNDTEPDPPAGAELCGTAVHIFSHIEWHMTGYLLRVPERLSEYTWVTAEERKALAIPGAFRYYCGILDSLGH